VRPIVDAVTHSYEREPHIYDEDPLMVLKRNIWVHPFHEDDPMGLIELIGAENVVFGSDYPHIEGMAEPLSYVKELDGLPREDVAKVMGGNLAKVMKMPFAA
jgi:hypothetical protein